MTTNKTDFLSVIMDTNTEAVDAFFTRLKWYEYNVFHIKTREESKKLYKKIIRRCTSYSEISLDIYSLSEALEKLVIEKTLETMNASEEFEKSVFQNYFIDEYVCVKDDTKLYSLFSEDIKKQFPNEWEKFASLLNITESGFTPETDGLKYYSNFSKPLTTDNTFDNNFYHKSVLEKLDFIIENMKTNTKFCERLDKSFKEYTELRKKV